MTQTGRENWRRLMWKSSQMGAVWCLGQYRQILPTTGCCRNFSFFITFFSFLFFPPGQNRDEKNNKLCLFLFCFSCLFNDVFLWWLTKNDTLNGILSEKSAFKSSKINTQTNNEWHCAVVVTVVVVAAVIVDYVNYGKHTEK